MFGWYVKADMADDQVAEWWSEALEANHNKERQLKLARAILDRCPEQHWRTDHRRILLRFPARAPGNSTTGGPYRHPRLGEGAQR